MFKRASWRLLVSFTVRLSYGENLKENIRLDGLGIFRGSTDIRDIKYGLSAMN
jgi:hypothetical protein